MFFKLFSYSLYHKVVFQYEIMENLVLSGFVQTTHGKAYSKLSDFNSQN